jgi:two-component system cell cycle sensor histidine kinase/response regulator CckA
LPPSRSKLHEELAILEARMRELRAQIEAESGADDPPPKLHSDRDGAALALDGNDIGYWEWDIAESRTFVSRSWARLLGYEVEELEPGLRAWERLVHPEDFPQALWKLEAHLRGELESYEAEFRMRSRSGEYRWILSRGRVIERAEDGLPLRMTGVHIDVHKRHSNEELMQQLAKHLGDGIFLASVRPRSLLYANPAFERLLGGSAERWIGKPLRSLLALVHPEDRRRVRQSFRAALSDGRFAEQFQILRPAGELAHVHVRSFPIYDAEGRLIRLSGSIQDTTELVTARRDKASLEQQLVHAQRIESIGRLAGGVAHDFNNVLTAVLGNVALLKNSIRRGHGEPGFVEAGLDHIEHAAREAAELTRQLLIFGRRQELRPELLTPSSSSATASACSSA